MINIALASLFYAIFQVLIGIAAPRLNDVWLLSLGAVFVTFTSIPLAYYQILQGQDMNTPNWLGVSFLFAANIAITGYTLFIGRSFRTAPPELVIPLVFGSAILMSTLVSLIINKTVPSIPQVIGLSMTTLGLFVLGMSK